MMWLNPSSRIGADEHFDQLLFDERYRQTSAHTTACWPKSCLVLPQHLQMLTRFIFTKQEEMEASNDGQRCAETVTG